MFENIVSVIIFFVLVLLVKILNLKGNKKSNNQYKKPYSGGSSGNSVYTPKYNKQYVADENDLYYEDSYDGDYELSKEDEKNTAGTIFIKILYILGLIGISAVIVFIFFAMTCLNMFRGL